MKLTLSFFGVRNKIEKNWIGDRKSQLYMVSAKKAIVLSSFLQMFREKETFVDRTVFSKGSLKSYCYQYI